MTIVLHLDTEQAALIEAALEFGVVALEARAKRIDPGKVVSDSHQLQAIKLQQVQMQMKAPPMVDYVAMAPEDRDTLDGFIQTYMSDHDEHVRGATLKAIIGHCDECRLKASTP